MLPELFQEKMKNLLQEEWDSFFQGYDAVEYHGLRINPLKVKKEDSLLKDTFSLSPIPWAETGFYYEDSERPGKHPFHEAGLYYIQEPSAMAPVEYLQVEPGQRVLDLCAAPGGKSTQIAGKLQGSGLLITNEVHPARAKILSENIERLGIRNAIVTNEDAGTLHQHFPGFFHRILVDAPCSGEGMFRKNEEATAQWNEENVLLCADRQKEILEHAAAMLLPGGRMCYSTCTFSPEENEQVISHFLAAHPEFHLVDAEKVGGMAAGRPEWSTDNNVELTKTIRLWPHLLKGEGHYLAVLEKDGLCPITEVAKNYPKFPKEWEDFSQSFLTPAGNEMLTGKVLLNKDQLYLLPEESPSLAGLKVLRPGLHLGTIKKGRFEPAHALALSLSSEEVTRKTNLTIEEAKSYLQGLTFPAEGEKGFHLITVEGYSLGFGKLAGNIMKNHYPKGLRKNP